MKKVLFFLVTMLLLSVSGIAQTTFTKITSASGLEAGANYLIVAHDEDLGVLAMGYQKPNNRHAVVVSENDDVISITPGTDPASETDVFQFTLGGSAGAWTLFDEVKGGYLYAASSSSNNMKTQTTLDTNGQWSITFNNDGTAEVVAQGENTRNNMRFNPNTQNNAPLFSCYAETSNVSTRVSFYKAGATQTSPEPSNYPTEFSTLVDGVDVYVLWEDATGAQLPHKYLVLASKGNITVPTDGTPVSDGDLAKNVAYGVGGTVFTGLEPNTTYHFAIFPYTNGGSNIDYKTDGTYPTANGTTQEIYYLLNEGFDNDLGSFEAVSITGEQVWHQGSYQGKYYANMNGFADGAAHENEDWLIAYVEIPQGVGYNEIWLEFSTAMKFDGDPLRVALSTDYDGQGDPTSAEWEDITDGFDFSTGNYEWVESGALDISANVNNQSFYLAFIYTSSDNAASSWEIDYVIIKGQDMTAVGENQIVTLNLYPNPAREVVSFKLEGNAQVSVFDVTGRMVSTMDMAAGESQYQVAELESGVYFLNVRYADGKKAVTRFVKF